MLNHVMVDLETLGTKPDAAFISIGAVRFDPETGDIDNAHSFYRRIDWDSAVNTRLKKRTIEPSTIKWWMAQGADARKEILYSGEEYTKVMGDFYSWWVSFGGEMSIWGNGSTFDVSILTDAFNYNPPWQFWAARDVRTVVDLARGIVERDSIPFVGTQHNALDDAIHQAKYVSAMVMALRNGR